MRPGSGVQLEEGNLLRLQPYIHHVLTLYGTPEQQQALGKFTVRGNCYRIAVVQDKEAFKSVQDLLHRAIRDVVYLVNLGNKRYPSLQILQFSLVDSRKMIVIFKAAEKKQTVDSVMDILRLRYPECGRYNL